MFNALKDKVTSEGARAYLNREYSRYGTVQHFEIDSQAKRIEVRVLLVGELEPVSITIDDYILETANNETWLKIESCVCSRRWLQHAVDDWVCGRSIKLPGWAKRFL